MSFTNVRRSKTKLITFFGTIGKQDLPARLAESRSATVSRNCAQGRVMLNLVTTK